MTYKFNSLCFELKLKLCSLVALRLTCQCALQASTDLVTNAQTESMRIRVDRPTYLIFGPKVRLKQMLLVFFTNSDPIILHNNYDIYKI